MKQPAGKTKNTKKTNVAQPVGVEFRPYRVLFLVVVVSVTCLVVFAMLGAGAELGLWTLRKKSFLGDYI